MTNEKITIRDQLNAEDFRVQNYSRVKQERDHLQEDLIAVRTKYEDAKLELDTIRGENIALAGRLEDVKSNARKSDNELMKTKEELTDVTHKYSKIISVEESASKLLRAERDRATDLHNKYVSAKADLTAANDSVHDLQRERTVLRSKLEERSSFVNQVEDRLQLINSKYQSTASELEKIKLKYSQCKDDYEAEIAELRSNLLSGTRRQTDLTDETAKMRFEIQKLKDELQHVRLSSDREMSELQKELNRVSNSLKAYQDLEKEYQDNIMVSSSARVEGGESASAADQARLFPGLCTKRNKYVEQAVKFSSRILQLERENKEACDTIKELTAALDKLRASLYSYRCAVSNMGEPTQTLQRKIISQEDQITSLHKALNACTQAKNTLDREKLKWTRDRTRLVESLDACGPNVVEIAKIKSEMNNIKKVLLQSTGLGKSTGARPKASGSGLPSAITISRGRNDE